MPRHACRNCRHRRVYLRRGLCRSCYRQPAIRQQYQRHWHDRQLPAGDFNGGYREPRNPTDAAPGSAEKIAALARRVAARRSLWHPEDYQFHEDTP